jgi:hypothetical protein
METDYSALASRIAASSDVLGCMILSSDGVVLGTFPVKDDGSIKRSWLRFAMLGDAATGFVRFSDSNLWAYVKAGPYAAFAVATAEARPGVLMDTMEQALLLASSGRRRACRRGSIWPIAPTEPTRPSGTTNPSPSPSPPPPFRP